MGVHATYLVHAGEDGPRDQMDWNPEFSRRARGFTAYAAIRALGGHGIGAMVERCCGHARRFADLLGSADGVEMLNDVVLNQVLVRFADSDHVTREVVRSVQADGTCWLSGTTWRDRAAMRISVSNWQTSEADVERSAAAILRAASVVAPASA